MNFIEVSYIIATEEAERIGLDQMTRVTSTTNDDHDDLSLATEHLHVQRNAIKMLRDRVKIIHEFVKNIQSNALPMNHDVLRGISNLCHRLPMINSEGFNDEFYVQCNDVALLTYLGTLTKCSNTINQFVNRLNIFLDRQGVSRRIRF